MRRVALIAVVMVVGPQVAGADGKFATRCKPGSKELAAAKTRLAQLDATITKAAADAPAAPLVKELHARLDTPCFQVAASLSEPDLSEATTFSLKRWWADGGHDWLASQLSGGRDVYFPPSARATLTLDHKPKHRLSRLLCRSTDATCGGETAGWRMRAEEAFRAAAISEARWPGSGYTVNLYARSAPPKEDPDASPRSQTLDVPLWRCANPAKGKRDYTTWQDCVQALRIPVPMFPAGAFRAPTSGWLVIRGRRGHYQFCDGLAAYDLATGAYYASKSCSGLALQRDGSVNAQRTDAARTPAIEAGRVSVDNLREAAWMMFLADEIEDHGYEDQDSFPLPPGLEPKVEIGMLRGTGSGSGWASSAQTTLAWTWIDGSTLVAEGTLTWPNSDQAGENHAADLLRVAESGLVQGCPSVPVPNPILKGCGKGGVSGIDASASSLCKVQAELSTRLAGYKCTTP